MNLIIKYFPEMTPGQQQQFSGLVSLYKEWNQKINLVSRKDMAHLWERHILHSLSISLITKFRNEAKILDFGTGGGFPGLPLAIQFPETTFHLVDSIGKKIMVISDLIHRLEINNVKAIQSRGEQINDHYDFIVCRAVAEMKTLCGWVHDKILPDSKHELHNGILCLKGGDIQKELLETGYHFKVYPLRNYFKEPFFETKKLVHLTF